MRTVSVKCHCHSSQYPSPVAFLWSALLLLSLTLSFLWAGVFALSWLMEVWIPTKDCILDIYIYKYIENLKVSIWLWYTQCLNESGQLSVFLYFSVVIVCGLSGCCPTTNASCFCFGQNVAKMKLYQKYYKVQSFIIIDCKICVNI